MRQRRLLIASPTTARGGAETYMLEVASEAAKHGWDVTIALESAPGTVEVVREAQDRPELSYVNARLSKARRSASLIQAAETVRLLARVRPAVIMLVLPWPNHGLGVMLGAALLRTPAAVVFQLAPWPTAGSRLVGLCRRGQRRQQWIAVSEQNRAAVATGFGVPPHAIRVIYNGSKQIRSQEPRDPVATRTSLREELQVPADARIVLTVASLHPRKGYLDLLSIIPDVVARLPDVVFAWAGDGELRDEIQAIIDANGLGDNVRLLGHRSDVEWLLVESEVFLLPSKMEGNSFAVMEALACGTPVISSDAGGTPEIVRDGIDGLIYRRDDPADLRRQLLWAFQHPTEMRAMATSGRGRVAEFSEERMLHETLTVLEELAGR